jgi:hypothetical protein
LSIRNWALLAGLCVATTVFASGTAAADSTLPIPCNPGLDVCGLIATLSCLVSNVLKSVSGSPITPEVETSPGSGLYRNDNTQDWGYWEYHPELNDVDESGAMRFWYRFTGYEEGALCNETSHRFGAQVGECLFDALEVSASPGDIGPVTVTVDPSACGIHYAPCLTDPTCLVVPPLNPCLTDLSCYVQFLEACQDGILLGSAWGDLEGTPPSVDTDACTNPFP